MGISQSARTVAFSLFFGLGCGIDLADTTEGLSQEEIEGEGVPETEIDVPEECRVWLNAIKAGMKKFSKNGDSLRGLSNLKGVYPDEKGPQKEARLMNPDKMPILQQLGVKVPNGIDKVHGSYIIEIKSATEYEVLCVLDEDQDGDKSVWMITDSQPIYRAK